MAALVAYSYTAPTKWANLYLSLTKVVLIITLMLITQNADTHLLITILLPSSQAVYEVHTSVVVDVGFIYYILLFKLNLQVNEFHQSDWTSL